jgi:hypothetical protein
MGYSGISKKTGRDYNFFTKLDVNWDEFGGGASDGYGPDIIIPFVTMGIMLLNEGTGIIEYSFNGTTLHGELNSDNATKGLVFDNRVISTIWFRTHEDSSGPIKISIQAWGS